MRHLFPFAKNLLEKNRQSPSTTKIAEAVGIARGTAYKYLVEMAEKNTISGIFEKYEVWNRLFRKEYYYCYNAEVNYNTLQLS